MPWDRLAVRGPRGFESYARLRFIPDPAYEGQSEGEADRRWDSPSDAEQVEIVLAILARHTTTPDGGYFCLWDGWPEPRFDGVPTVSIPNRDYWLFRGAITDSGSWGDPAGAPTPAFVWPADRAWCVTCDIDPHFATIGATAEAIDELIAEGRVDVVRDDPDREPPYYG